MNLTDNNIYIIFYIICLIYLFSIWLNLEFLPSIHLCRLSVELTSFTVIEDVLSFLVVYMFLLGQWRITAYFPNSEVINTTSRSQLLKLMMQHYYRKWHSNQYPLYISLLKNRTRRQNGCSLYIPFALLSPFIHSTTEIRDENK